MVIHKVVHPSLNTYSDVLILVLHRYSWGFVAVYGAPSSGGDALRTLILRSVLPTRRCEKNESIHAVVGLCRSLVGAIVMSSLILKCRPYLIYRHPLPPSNHVPKLKVNVTTSLI